MLNVQNKKWKKLKSKMNQLVKIVKNAVHRWLSNGRYGKFMACSNFPDCRNTKAIVKEIGVKCPKCDDGQVVERKSKKGRVFYGCSNYPECDFISWINQSAEAVQM